MPFTNLPMNATTIVITAIMVLASAAVLYSQGAFSRVRPIRKSVNNKAGNGGDIGQRNAN